MSSAPNWDDIANAEYHLSHAAARLNVITWVNHVPNSGSWVDHHKGEFTVSLTSGLAALGLKAVPISAVMMTSGDSSRDGNGDHIEWHEIIGGHHENQVAQSVLSLQDRQDAPSESPADIPDFGHAGKLG